MVTSKDEGLTTEEIIAIAVSVFVFLLLLFALCRWFWVNYTIIKRSRLAFLESKVEEMQVTSATNPTDANASFGNRI